MKLKAITLALFAVTSLFTMAQKKQFSLDDLIPGGSTYYSVSYPQNANYTWWGDQCIELGVDKLSMVDKRSGSTVPFVDIADVNTFLQSNNLRKLQTLQYVSFPDKDHPYMLLKSGNQYTLVNFKTNKIVWHSTVPNGAGNLDRNNSSLNLAYTLAGNLYVQTADGVEHQLSVDGTPDLTYGTSVHRDEFGISKGTFWSSKGRRLAFYKMDQSMVSKYPQVNITPYDDSQSYAGRDSSDLTSRCATLEPDAYPMAGETSHKVWVGIYDTQTDKTVYLDAGDPTDRYFTNIAWSPDETKLYVITLNRDQTDGSLDEYDAISGQKIRTLFTEHNDRYFEPINPIQFLPWDSSKFIYQTRRNGYNHIYLYSIDKLSGKPVEATSCKQLTQGEYEVIDVLGFNELNKSILFTSNKTNPLQKNIFAVDTRGKVTPYGNSTGWHSASLSASGTYVLDNYSSPVIPRHIDIVNILDNYTVNLLSAADPWAAYDVPEIKTGCIKAADGITDLYYRLILPTGFDPSKTYPAVVYVYGGPHAHNVDASRAWGARGWDIYMASRGYVMFCIDNRGSEHRGLAFEQSTFRNLGVEEMKDQLCGVNYLKSLPYVDANRLGVHGWSYGGFMTTSLMCSFSDKQGADADNPGVFAGESPFKVGVAGGPVIDWRFYEVMYGERYMDTPQSNPDGYRNTSLLGKAKNLKGRLMVIYGGNDPTCVPQHTLSFVRACIDAGTYPDLFTYPGDGHNMFGTDRVHLHHVITRYFDDNLKK